MDNEIRREIERKKCRWKLEVCEGEGETGRERERERGNGRENIWDREKWEREKEKRTKSRK